MESLESIEHQYRKMIEALFIIAHPGPVKDSLWQTYQQMPQGEFQATVKVMEKELHALRQWKKDWMLDWS